jgi:hypothetical protein
MSVKSLTKQFVSRGFQSFREEFTTDSLAVSAIGSRKMPRPDRAKIVSAWIAKYKVHRIRGATSLGLASAVIEFADSRRRHKAPLTRNQIKTEFRALEAALQQHLNLGTENRNSRAIESLTSKTLWLCYPHDVPMLDRNVENALRVLARLEGRHFGPAQSRYECFVDVWFDIYEQIEPSISLKDLGDYRYKVRVFDRLLWWLGQDSFPNLTEFRFAPKGRAGE